MRILTFGTFDHFHPGHQYLLREAASLGDLHVVIARDSNVEHIKGRVPEWDESQRLSAVQEAFPDATVILGDPEDYLRPIAEINPDLILLGYDQRLPPGVTESDLPCEIRRCEAFRPEEFKSSLRRADR